VYYISLAADYGTSLLSDHVRVLQAICQPGLVALSSATVMTLVSATLKIFGEWAALMSKNWNHEKMLSVQKIAITVKQGIETFTSHFDLEVQERVWTIY
jgi:bifunctional N-acetylglucosamine-1-phosphate-uridyltransferase/glucosamine-1-phosphate-acetyltransferase GlmU-like protein